MARKTHRVENVSYEALAQAVKNPDIQIEAVEGGFSVRTDNRREESALAAAIEAAEKAPTQERATWTRRYVERESVADAQGLNRGRSWTCGEIDIQTKGAHPSWEGRAICYVYE